MSLCLIVEIMRSYIWRITNYHIKASFLKYFGKLLLPVEGFFASYLWIADERVTTFDVFAEGIKLAVRLGSSEPKG